MRGYAGKFLEVDLTTEKIKEVNFSEEVLRQYVGGRALSVKILWDRLGKGWEEVDPLGPENILLVLTGPLTGYIPGARVCISGKSPQSNGIVGSTVSGEFPVDLKCAGHDGLIITGRASGPVYIFIKDKQVEIRDATHVWGKTGKETVKILNHEIRNDLAKKFPKYGVWKEPSILYIGPAGENVVRVAAVMQKWTHAAGYGGYGAVMGSKNLKALVIKGTGPLPSVVNMSKVMDLIQKIATRSYLNEAFRRWGTAPEGYYTGSAKSSQPIKNWQEEWHDERELGVDKFERRVWVKRYWGDFGCPLTCMKIAVVKHGLYKGSICDNPDYEAMAYLGTNLGIFNPEEIVYLSALIDNLGLSSINCGNLLGFVGELYQRGILTKEDTGQIDLKWGDVEAFSILARKIAHREGFGDILAEGTYRAALKIGELKGIDVMKYAVQVKGMALGAHGVRSGLDYTNPISYACSTQAGDHQSLASLHGGEKVRVLSDSAIYCNFLNVHGLVWDFFKAVAGWNITQKEWENIIAPRILHIQRAVLLLGGTDVNWEPLVDDDNPPRFYEPLPSGPQTGKKIDRAKFEDMRSEYYKMMGWDERGIPRSDVLLRLGLEDVDLALNKVRERR